jgi:hypothetical protein
LLPRVVVETVAGAEGEEGDGAMRGVTTLVLTGEEVVLTTVLWAGQFVTSGAQEVMLMTSVLQIVCVDGTPVVQTSLPLEVWEAGAAGVTTLSEQGNEVVFTTVLRAGQLVTVSAQLVTVISCVE